MNILVAKNGSQLGPFSEGDIRTKLASGELTPTDLGWKEGMPSWAPLSQMFAAAPPPPTPPAPTLPPPQTYPPPAQNNPGAYTPQPQTYPPQGQGQPQQYAPQPYQAPPPYNTPQGQYGAPQNYNSPYPSPYQSGAMQQPWGMPGAMGYGGFWIRFLALIIDSFALSIPLGLIAFAAIAAADYPEDALIFIYPLFGIVGILYQVLMESSAKQATLGKLALGLKVTDENGNRIGFGQAFGRTLGKAVSSFTMGIGYIMAGLSARKQALHDMMAHTLIVKR